MWDESRGLPKHISHYSGVDWDDDDHERPRRQTPTPGGAIAGFVLILVLTVIFASAGAPGVFLAFMVLMAIVSLVGGLAASEKEARRIRHAAWEKETARERLVEDVAYSVRESMKGTIKVRCRYCGGLNGEEDEKCESCGAPL